MPPRSVRRVSHGDRPRSVRVRWFKVLTLGIAAAAVIGTVWGNVSSDKNAAQRQSEILREQQRVRALRQEIDLTVAYQTAVVDVLAGAEATFVATSFSTAAVARFREKVRVLENAAAVVPHGDHDVALIEVARGLSRGAPHVDAGDVALAVLDKAGRRVLGDLSARLQALYAELGETPPCCSTTGEIEFESTRR